MTAALALDLITGAGLYEEAAVEPEPEEAPEEEAEAAPVDLEEALEEPEPPTMVERVSQDVERWTLWWNQNRERFAAGVRYRYGEPVSPSVLVAALGADRGARTVRQLTYDELVIRYGCDVPFEPDGFLRGPMRKPALSVAA